MGMDEAKLVAGLQARDPAAIEVLVQMYGDRLLRSATLLCGNQTHAQDLVQDTFVQALGSVHRFRKQAGLYTWLHSILLNLARHHHRDGKRLVYDNELAAREDSATEEPLNWLDFGNATAELDRSLRRLSDSHRKILVLRYYERLKIHEIAQLLNISKGTVKSRLHYAIQEMQKLLPAEMNLFGAGGTKETV
jgi:RNA polymerase sigma-70 factor (ECF subfamily)